jgi:nitrite reductase/ring-hydroxylating ferredoxin subunit
MNKIRLIIGIIMSIVFLGIGVSACGGSGRSIKATWIQPLVVGDSVIVPVSTIDKDIITHFKVKTSNKELTFMAYTYSDQVYTRADICPPCHSENFSLKDGTLVCDTCGSVFNATTGAGIGGACRAYPKAAATYEVKDGNIVMKVSDLSASFQKTLNP